MNALIDSTFNNILFINGKISGFENNSIGKFFCRNLLIILCLFSSINIGFANTWTLQNTPFVGGLANTGADNSWLLIAYGNGLWVAVASSGTGNRVMTSSVGINRTSRNAAAEKQWRDVSFGDVRFVAVSNTATGNRAIVFESLYGKVKRYKVKKSGQFLWVVPNDWPIVGGQGTNKLKVLGELSPGINCLAAVNTRGVGAEVVYE